MVAVSPGSFLPLMVPCLYITRCFSTNFTEGSCLDEKFREAECHVSTFGVDGAQRASVARREVCLKRFKVVGHEFAVNPRLEMGCMYFHQACGLLLKSDSREDGQIPYNII